MHTAEYVTNLLQRLIAEGRDPEEIAWEIACACEGWAYVFGAWGEWCDPDNRRVFFNRKGAAHPTIKSACKNFDGTKGCKNCKWYPYEKRTRIFDCRGFTYWVLKQVYGWKLTGGGATSQWNNASNWEAKGTIDTIPNDRLVCLFIRNGSTMEHTGFGFRGETCECSKGVQHFAKRNPKWTHWAVPACIGKEIPKPEPTPVPVPSKDDDFPTLKKGSKGEWVTLLQTKLVQAGYDVGSYGIDGSFGKGTEKAVKAFQHDHGLKEDGIAGKNTWDALNTSEPEVFFTATVRHLSRTQAEKLKEAYPNCEIQEEA